MKKYKNEKRRYLSFSDQVQDLTTDYLISLIPRTRHFQNQMIIMKEIEKRNELQENKYFDLLETCNGI
tara:strand:- start:2780 stop:2983 length:204 start_codon:yes stop_codon:yes gene_type:complete